MTMAVKHPRLTCYQALARNPGVSLKGGVLGVPGFARSFNGNGDKLKGRTSMRIRAAEKQDLSPKILIPQNTYFPMQRNLSLLEENQDGHSPNSVYRNGLSSFTCGCFKIRKIVRVGFKAQNTESNQVRKRQFLHSRCYSLNGRCVLLMSLDFWPLGHYEPPESLSMEELKRRDMTPTSFLDDTNTKNLQPRRLCKNLEEENQGFPKRNVISTDR